MELYTRIDKVKFNDGYNTFVLTCEDYIDGQMFEVDLKSDMFFVCDYEIVERETLANVTSIQEVFKFCKDNNIRINDNRLGYDYLIVGGEEDTIVNEKLRRVCVYDLIEYAEYNERKFFVEAILDYAKQLYE